MKRDKEGHYIMIKGSIQEEDITIINIYAPNIGAPQYVSQNTGVGCHFLLQGIIPTQGLNLGLLHCRQILYRLSYKGSPRQMLTSMKGKINDNTIIVGDFNTPLIPVDRSTNQKINKETQTLNDTMDELDPIDIYRTFHSQTINFTFFSSTHGTFSRIDHILRHKSSLSKLKKKKKKEIIPSIFSDHNAVRSDVNYRRKTVKNSNI